VRRQLRISVPGHHVFSTLRAASPPILFHSVPVHYPKACRSLPPESGSAGERHLLQSIYDNATCREPIERRVAKCFHMKVLSKIVAASSWQVIALFFALAGGAFSGPLTVCDLSQRRDLQEKTIAVEGRMVFTSHGAFLICDATSPDIAILYPRAANAPHVGFDLDPRSLELLSPFFRPTGGTAAACGVVVGQLFSKRRFHLKKSGGGPVGNGFGSRGAFQFAFVLKSVQSIRHCD
jgi:hypothetical protein